MPTPRPVHRIWTTLLLALVATAALAQPQKTKVVLYKDRLAAQFDTVDCVKNVVKINPLLFFRGEIPIYYERALTPRLSLEVGFGVTLRDYLALGFTEDADDFGAGTQIIPNPSFHIAARFYLVDDLEPQGWYLQPEFAHLVYTKDIQMKGDDGQFTGEELRDERTYNDLRLLAGYQVLGLSSNWLLDFYGGLGFRSRNRIMVSETLDLASQVYEYEVTEESDNVPMFYFGMKLGLGW